MKGNPMTDAELEEIAERYSYVSLNQLYEDHGSLVREVRRLRLTDASSIITNDAFLIVQKKEKAEIDRLRKALADIRGVIDECDYPSGMNSSLKSIYNIVENVLK